MKNFDKKVRVSQEVINEASLVFIGKKHHAGRKHNLYAVADGPFCVQFIMDTTIVVKLTTLRSEYLATKSYKHPACKRTPDSQYWNSKEHRHRTQKEDINRWEGYEFQQLSPRTPLTWIQILTQGVVSDLPAGTAYNGATRGQHGTRARATVCYGQNS